MHDNYISKASLLSWLLWGLAVLAGLLVWALAVMGASLEIEIAMSLTAVFILTVASVWQVRVYVTRLCALFRVSAGLQGPDAELHTIGRTKSPV